MDIEKGPRENHWNLLHVIQILLPMGEEYNNKEQDISSQILIDSRLKHVPDRRLLLKGLYATDTLSFNGLS